MPRDGRPPQQDARILLARAQRELGAGAVTVAAALTANAVVAAPTLSEAHDLLARLAAHPEGGRNLFPWTTRSVSRQSSRGPMSSRPNATSATHSGSSPKAQAFAPETPWADVPWVTARETAAETDPATVAAIALDMLDILRSNKSANSSWMPRG